MSHGEHGKEGTARIRNFPTKDPAAIAFEEGRERLWVGRFDLQDGHGSSSSKKNTHPYAVLMLVTNGSSRMSHAGELELRPGDVHLIPPGDAHGSQHGGAVSGWFLAFWPEQSEHPLRLFSQVRHGCHPVFTPEPAQLRRLEAWFVALEAEFTGREARREQALAALLQLVLVELERASTSSLAPVPEPPNLARAAVEHIELNALGPLTLADVARAIGRTAAHVATVVRNETGRTVGEWILLQRMAEARRRLRLTDEPMEEVARHVGYADVTHFIRLFRRMHGVTPAKWRRASSGQDRPSTSSG